jgi:hypothetical protein
MLSQYSPRVVVFDRIDGSELMKVGKSVRPIYLAIVMFYLEILTKE